MKETRRIHTGSLLAALGLAAIWLTAFVAGGATSRWDLSLFSALRPGERTGLVELAWLITWLGDWIILVPTSLVATGVLLWRGLRLQALALLGTVGAVRILVALQKTWFGRVRPEGEQWMTEYTYSFPSAHAANALATYVAIAILLSGSRTAIAVAVACSVIVGITRMLLGVHWPSDVIGGWAFAGLAMILLWRLRAARQIPAR